VFHPHALASEAICNPLLIMLVERLVRLELAEDAGWRDVLIAGAMTAVIAFVRHVYLLLPLAVAMWLLLMRPQGIGRPSRIAAYLAHRRRRVDAASGRRVRHPQRTLQPAAPGPTRCLLADWLCRRRLERYHPGKKFNDRQPHTAAGN
jgi:hypothetical protein